MFDRLSELLLDLHLAAHIAMESIIRSRAIMTRAAAPIADPSMIPRLAKIIIWPESKKIYFDISIRDQINNLTCFSGSKYYW